MRAVHLGKDIVAGLRKLLGGEVDGVRAAHRGRPTGSHRQGGGIGESHGC